MHVHVSSNIISGAYTCFEILLAIAVVRNITTIISCLNVREIYDKRKGLHLKYSRLQAISSHGLTSWATHTFATTLFLVVIALATAGGFAIVGVTGEIQQDVQVRYLVKRAPPGYVFNPESQYNFTMDGLLISGRLRLLLSHLVCVRQAHNIYKIWQYSYDGEDLNSVRWPALAFPDVTCISPDAGFRSEVAFEQSYPLGEDNPEIVEKNCTWHVRTEQSKLLTLTQAHVCNTSQLNVLSTVRQVAACTGNTVKQIGECRLQIREMWCYNTNFAVFCVALVERPSGAYGVMTYFHRRRSLAFHAAYVADTEALGSEKLQAMVILTSLGMTSSFTVLNMLSLHVEENATVSKIAGDRQETKINLLLLLSTAGPAVAITLVISVVALVLWAKTILVPGRLKYNRFNSEMDLLYCAAIEKFQDGGCRYRHGSIAVQVEEGGMYARPVRVSA